MHVKKNSSDFVVQLTNNCYKKYSNLKIHFINVTSPDLGILALAQASSYDISTNITKAHFFCLINAGICKLVHYL